MRPGEYAYDLGRRQVVCVTHVDSTFVEGLTEGGEIRSALVGNFVVLEMKPSWWRLRGRLDEYTARPTLAVAPRAAAPDTDEAKRRDVHAALDAVITRGRSPRVARGH